MHHSLASSARHYGGGRETAAWWVMMVANRIFHFAVPVFLFVSALLLARSLAKHPRPDWKRFYLRRVQRSVWPFLIWTGLWILARLFILREAKDVMIVTAAWPWGGSLTGPALLVDPSVWTANLVWGKGAYHMYFLAVLIQMALVFPLIYYVMRRLSSGHGVRSPELPLSAMPVRGEGAGGWGSPEDPAGKNLPAATVFGLVLLGSIALQLLVFWGQGNWWRLGSPWSLVISYLPPVLVGTWLGLNWSSWPSVWRAWRWPIGLLTAGAFAYYLSLSVLELRREPIPSFDHRSALILYAFGLSFLLLALAGWLSRSWVGRAFAWMGNISLALFLIHPLFLYLLGMPSAVRTIKGLPLSPVVSFSAMFVLSVAFTLLVARLRLDGLLFGRQFYPRRPAGKHE